MLTVCTTMITSNKIYSPTFNVLGYVRGKTKLAFSIDYKIPANKINPKIPSG